jgi:hypothetical protein
VVLQSEVKREKKEGGGGGQGGSMPSPVLPDMDEAQPTIEELQGYTVVSVVTLRVRFFLSLRLGALTYDVSLRRMMCPSDV